MKNKAIFIASKLWIIGFGLYALFTLPALFLLPMYMISFALAFVCSIPSMLLLTGFLWLYRRFNTWDEMPRIIFNVEMVTAAFIFIGTLIAAKYYMTAFDANQNFWEAYLSFILFPIAGFLAGALTIWSNRHYLFEFISKKNALKPHSS